MKIRWYHLGLALCLWILSSLVSPVWGAVTFVPGPEIALSGSSEFVHFDTDEALYTASSTLGGPRYISSKNALSGAFYLSGAGWITFASAPSEVVLDCRGQSYPLTSSCSLSGLAVGELIGDVVFDPKKIELLPTGYLSGVISTYVGQYSLSGIVFPLIPVEFSGGHTVKAHHQKTLTLSGAGRYTGAGAWGFTFTPSGYSARMYTAPLVADLSHASDYVVSITDPNGSVTQITDFTVSPDTPSPTLSPDIAGTLRQEFCLAHPDSCPDGSDLSPLSLYKLSSTAIANGHDGYTLRLRIRDRYGNATAGGKVRIRYTDTVKNIQIRSDENYGEISDVCIYNLSGYGCAVTNSLPDFYNQYDGSFTYQNDNILGDIEYRFDSLAPTGAIENILALSGILYTDTLGSTTDITQEGWKDPLIFKPWYQSSLSVNGDIIVSEPVDFRRAITQEGTYTAPGQSFLSHIQIGSDNTNSAFSRFQSVATSCTKYFQNTGINECNWMGAFIDPVVISSQNAQFTGVYTPATSHPPLESVTAKNFVTYVVDGTRILYADGAPQSLGMAKYGKSAVLILGQNNIGDEYGGLNYSSRADLWNTIHKSVALLSRHRNSYSDVDYTIESARQDLTNTYFDTKKALVVVGADAYITENIAKREHPLLVLALTDSRGNGGNIYVSSGVTDVSASLFAEHSIFSSGANQLYIGGSFVGANTARDTIAGICPYYVSKSDCIDPAKYDIEKLRGDYLITPDKKALNPTAQAHQDYAIVIEYDPRIISDPSPFLSQNR